MSMPPLLSGGISRFSRAASGFAAKSTSGFHVLRVDGYSLSKTLPGGASIESHPFFVGNRNSLLAWHLCFYPNGVDPTRDDSDHIALLLFVQNRDGGRDRLRAQFRFSLLDAAGKVAYARPTETAVFTSPGPGDDPEELAVGFREFVRKDELERRCGESLVRDDSLAVLCEVAGVTEVKGLDVQPRKKYVGPGDDEADADDPEYWSEGRYIRHCLSVHRRRVRE